LALSLLISALESGGAHQSADNYDVGGTSTQMKDTLTASVDVDGGELKVADAAAVGSLASGCLALICGILAALLLHRESLRGFDGSLYLKIRPATTTAPFAPQVHVPDLLAKLSVSRI